MCTTLVKHCCVYMLHLNDNSLNTWILAWRVCLYTNLRGPPFPSRPAGARAARWNWRIAATPRGLPGAYRRLSVCRCSSTVAVRLPLCACHPCAGAELNLLCTVPMLAHEPRGNPSSSTAVNCFTCLSHKDVSQTELVSHV